MDSNQRCGCSISFHFIELEPKFPHHNAKCVARVCRVEKRVGLANVVGPPACPSTIVQPIETISVELTKRLKEGNYNK